MMGEKTLTFFFFPLLKTIELNVHVDLKRSNKMTTYGNTGLNTQKYGTLKDKEVTLKAHALCSHYLQGHPRPCRLFRRSGVKRSKWYDKQRGQGKTLYNVTPTAKAGKTLLVTPVTFTWTHHATEGETPSHALNRHQHIIHSAALTLYLTTCQQASEPTQFHKPWQWLLTHSHKPWLIPCQWALG